MNNDLISRQAAIDAIKKDIMGGLNFEGILKEMPSIDAEPERHGKWSRERLPSTNGGSYEVFRCSECQSAFNWRMVYCGHCGAKMDGGNE